jgi:hypothetical protein
MRSAVPWARRTRLPANCSTGSAGGSHGASPATAVTAGCPATRNAARAPMEWPISTTGTAPNRATVPSIAARRSCTGEACSPFQPRTRYRGRDTTIPLPRSPCWMARASGIIRSTAGSSGLTGSALTSVPPCATTTAPRTPTAAVMSSVPGPSRGSSATVPSGFPQPIGASGEFAAEFIAAGSDIEEGAGGRPGSLRPVVRADGDNYHGREALRRGARRGVGRRASGHPSPDLEPGHRRRPGLADYGRGPVGPADYRPGDAPGAGRQRAHHAVPTRRRRRVAHHPPQRGTVARSAASQNRERPVDKP